MLNTAFARLSQAMLAVALCAGAAGPALAQGTKVAYVATERLMTDSKLAKAADAKIEAEFSKRDKSIKEQFEAYRTSLANFEKTMNTLSEPDRAKRARELRDMETDIQRRRREFGEDLNQRRNEERSLIAQRASKIIEKIALDEGIDIVLQDVAFYSSRADITDKILKELDK